MAYLAIGSSPSDEDCAQVGEPDYYDNAVRQCIRFIDVIRKKHGPEPEGARLAVKWFDHDFGKYAEVVCNYTEDIPQSVEYAFTVEGDPPLTWKG